MVDRSTLSYVESCLENEGIHYCFTMYSYFDEVKDKKFHSLRKKYVQYAQELEAYIREKADEERDGKSNSVNDTGSEEYDTSGDELDSSDEEIEDTSDEDSVESED